MTTSLPPWQIEDDPFIEIYNELRKVLHSLGMEFPHRQRLDTFRLHLTIQKLRDKVMLTGPVSDALVDQYNLALYLIDELTQFKINGYEPENKNGKYI